jgi:hypothetical protein
MKCLLNWDFHQRKRTIYNTRFQNTRCHGDLMPGICQAQVQINTKAIPHAHIPLQNTNANYNINVVKRFVSHRLERVPGWDICLYAIPITYGHTWNTGHQSNEMTTVHWPGENLHKVMDSSGTDKCVDCKADWSEWPLANLPSLINHVHELLSHS